MVTEFEVTRPNGQFMLRPLTSGERDDTSDQDSFVMSLKGSQWTCSLDICGDMMEVSFSTHQDLDFVLRQVWHMWGTFWTTDPA